MTLKYTHLMIAYTFLRITIFKLLSKEEPCNSKKLAGKQFKQLKHVYGL